jgi:hypothetical protein
VQTNSDAGVMLIERPASSDEIPRPLGPPFVAHGMYVPRQYRDREPLDRRAKNTGVRSCRVEHAQHPPGHVTCRRLRPDRTLCQLSWL